MHLKILPNASGCASASSKYIKVEETISNVNDIAIAKKSSYFLFEIAINTFLKATEYLPTRITLNNLNNLNNLNKKVSFVPAIKKGNIAKRSMRDQKLVI